MDRLDRIALAGSAPRAASAVSTPTTSSTRLAGVPARSVVTVVPTTYSTVITPTRGARFVDYMACPLCFHPRVGITFQGELRDGSKVHELFAHSMGVGMVHRDKPRCLGAGLRVVFKDGTWQGVTS